MKSSNKTLICLLTQNDKDIFTNYQLSTTEKLTKEKNFHVIYVYNVLLINNDISDSDIDELNYLLEQYREINTLIFVYNKQRLCSNSKINKSFNHKKYKIIMIS